MTDSQKSDCAAAVLAWLNGKPVQFRFYTESDEKWRQPANMPMWNFANVLYRPKREPAVVPWSAPSDPPSPCYLRSRFVADIGQWSMVIGAGQRGLQVSNDDAEISVIEWKDISDFVHSTDRRAWQPCTKPAP